MLEQSITSAIKVSARKSHAERLELSDSAMFEAAVQLIVEQGTAKTTLKSVGESAGYSRGLAGSRFSSKIGLFCFVIRRVAEYWLDAMKKATHNKSGYAAIHATIDAHYQFSKKTPKSVRAFYILWFESIGLDNEMRDIVASIHRRRLRDVTEWVEQGIEAGEISTNVDARAVAQYFLTSMFGIVYQWLIDPGQELDIERLHDNLKITMRIVLPENDAHNQTDEFDSIVTSRGSIRAFLPDPVETDMLEKIFSVANHAPSNCNTQPWQAHVVSGARRDVMRDALMKTIGEGEHQLDFPYEGKYSGVYRERQLDVGLMLYKALGVRRDDKEGKRQAFLRNLEFFGAPHVAFIFMPDWADIREAADVGMYAQNLMLILRAHGIASCPQTILGYNADVVREQLEIDPSQKLLFGISFGYADMSRPENKIRPSRATVSESTCFYE